MLKAAFVNYNVAGSFNNNVYSAGADYHVLPDLDVNGGVYVTSDRNDTTNHSLLVALGTQYQLSRRTALYGQVAVVNNHGAMNTGLDSNLMNGVPGTATGVNIGIQTSF